MRFMRQEFQIFSYYFETISRDYVGYEIIYTPENIIELKKTLIIFVKKKNYQKNIITKE